MNPIVVNLVIGDQVISLDAPTFAVMLSAIDLTMSDGLLNERYTISEIDRANEARSAIEFARLALETSQHHLNLSPLAMSTKVT